jgi:SAM-dependent methyltransferase
MAKTVQALRALHVVGASGRVIEFGSGWGNLAIPLARAGFEVTAVDIDAGFTARLRRLASESRTVVKTFDGSFIEASRSVSGRFAAVIFQSSFHHCIDFDELLGNITRRVLAEDGNIYFFSEPIFQEFSFPWGIRYDGEALWAVMFNGWLELGFREDFFIDLLFKHGLVAAKVPGVPGIVGDGWRATRVERGLMFGEIVLSSRHEAGFFPLSGGLEWGRFCRDVATLPSAGMSFCILTVQNFGPVGLRAAFRSGHHTDNTLIQAGERRTLTIVAPGLEIEIKSETYIPDVLLSNGDKRQVGIAIIEIRWVQS